MTEKKVCQSCKEEFEIAAEDFAFYEKIQVPAPTRCPDCRQQRRYAWRNERTLYRRKCDLCGKVIVTIYSPNKPFKVYCVECWWSDKWDARTYGREFDFSRPFFEQFKELQLEVPRIALLSKNSTNSEYAHHAGNNKDVYLSFSTFGSENVLYSNNIWVPTRDSMDCYLATYGEGSELAYECIDSSNLFSTQFCFYCQKCSECYYCYDCRGCSNCFLSSGLRNKEYYFLNKPCTKDEYEKRVSEFNLGSFKTRKELYERFIGLMKNSAVHRAARIDRSVNVSGNNIDNSKNSFISFEINKIEDGKYLSMVADAKDSRDVYHAGFSSEIIYEGHAVSNAYSVLFSHLCYQGSYLQYADACHDCENVFGCSCMNKAKFCILNKQYSEEEYKTLVPKIIEHMKETGEYGEFFPPSLSPFGYNETQGQVYMPLTKETAAAKGYKWEDAPIGTFGKETLKPEQIPDDIKSVDDSILKQILACESCKKNYTIVKAELGLYRKGSIPIPRMCPDCRYKRRIATRQPRKVWNRKCMCAGISSEDNKHKNATEHFHKEEHCASEFKTSFEPGRPETIYCEECYQSEVR
jgi:Zn ribbon nucleic-acid-binding protein